MLLRPGLMNREVELVHSHDWVHCMLIAVGPCTGQILALGGLKRHQWMEPQ